VSRDVWAARYTEIAHQHWTAERTAELTGGKRLAIVPGEAPLLLRALGLLDGDAAMSPAHVRKFLQINHLVRLVEPAFAELRTRHPTIQVLDAGCGRSYLTLLLAWCARERWNHRLEVLGIDRDPDVIAECRRRTAIAELDDVVRFETAELAAAEVGAVHAVVSLHACDTATCDAIAIGAKLDAEVIAVAPCCQAELARGWATLAEQGAAGGFAPIWNAGHLRRETAAHVTDAMRVLLLRAAGYQVTATELVAEGHSTKNTLLRATRGAPDPSARAEYDALVSATGGCGLALAARV
jgi:hypothetical protein